MKRAIGVTLIALAILTAGCVASVGYNRGYYQQRYSNGYRYDRDWDRYNRRDGVRHDRHDRDYDRDGYRRY